MHLTPQSAQAAIRNGAVTEKLPWWWVRSSRPDCIIAELLCLDHLPHKTSLQQYSEGDEGIYYLPYVQHVLHAHARHSPDNARQGSLRPGDGEVTLSVPEG